VSKHAETKHAILQVLDGKPVVPVPVVPAYPNCASFPPGLFIYRRVRELWYERVRLFCQARSL